jgi:hypothetical protein
MSANDIFKKTKSDWAVYAGELHIFTLVGGIPKDPETIRKFIKAKLDVGDYELNRITAETIADMGLPDPSELSSEQLNSVIDSVMADKFKGNSFKRIDGQLVWETRCLFAAIKEAMNVLYPGNSKWPGQPEAKISRKGFEGFAKERIVVKGEGRGRQYMYLGKEGPDVENRILTPDVEGEERIKHITGPQGPRSVITVVDVVEEVDVKFEVEVLEDFVAEETWGKIWRYVENTGVGADRARNDGRCELVRWEKIS